MKGRVTMATKLLFSSFVRLGPVELLPSFSTFPLQRSNNKTSSFLFNLFKWRHVSWLPIDDRLSSASRLCKMTSIICQSSPFVSSDDIDLHRGLGWRTGPMRAATCAARIIICIDRGVDPPPSVGLRRSDDSLRSMRTGVCFSPNRRSTGDEANYVHGHLLFDLKPLARKMGGELVFHITFLLVISFNKRTFHSCVILGGIRTAPQSSWVWLLIYSSVQLLWRRNVHQPSSSWIPTHCCSRLVCKHT